MGVTSPAERQYVSLFQAIGDNLRNRPYAWPQLKRGYTFASVTGQSRYELPGDFYRLLESNQWDTTNGFPMTGPVSDAEIVGSQNSAVVNTSSNRIYRLVGPVQYLFSTSPYSQRSAGSFEIDPAGANDTDQFFMGYLSCNWIWPRDWVTATGYSVGDIRSGNGNIYIATSSGGSGATRPSHSTGSASDGGVTWAVYREPYLCAPANTALNDSDICLFDQDIMVDGMVWAYKRAKGQEYLQLKQDWENQVKSGYARFNGPVRINMGDGGDDDRPWPFSAEGGWSV